MKKFFIALIGGTVSLIGVAMLVLPGPGALVIAGGLAILATEFIWARRAMRNAKSAVAKVRRKTGFRAWWRHRKSRAKASQSVVPIAGRPKIAGQAEATSGCTHGVR
jgi:uncharacterized protein (TIGR02611 family)